MATFFSSWIVLIIFLVQLLSLSRQISGEDGRLLDDVCSQTRNQALCRSYLSDVPSALTAPLAQLGQIVIDQTEFKAGQTKRNINTYVFKVKSTDPKLYALASQCENLYKDALESVLKLSPLLTSQQYSSISKEADTIRNKVDACEAGFGNQSPFRADNQIVEVLADVIFVISNRLGKSN